MMVHGALSSGIEFSAEEGKLFNTGSETIREQGQRRVRRTDGKNQSKKN